MKKENILTAVKPLAAELIVTMLALLLLAFLMLKLEWGEEKLRTGVLVVYGIACLLGGWCAGKGTGHKKFLWGLGYGALYFILLWFLSLAGGRVLTSDTRQIAAAFAICSLSGMAGGMFCGFLITVQPSAKR